MVVNGDNKYSLKRKEGQEKEVIPSWYSTQGYQLFKEKYLHQNTPLEQYRLIARTAAKHIVEFVPDAEELFFQLLWSGKLSPSTPVLANMGTNRGLPVSCSGSYIQDSIDGFYTARRETAILTKYGFGTSSYLGDIRPRGSNISIGGKASGVLPVFKGFVRDMQEVSQGSTRRGSWAGYLPISHGDFDELCDYLHHNPDDLNVGWCITDKDVELLRLGDPELLRRYQKVMKVKMITGKGYFFFTDKVNRHRPASYTNNNLDVKASNLCVAPETLILTDKGHIPIAILEGQKIRVWNGHEWSSVEVARTGINQKLIKVTTDSGNTLECTPYHKFYVSTNYRGGVVEKRANELSPGDKLIKLDTPIIEGEKELAYAYTNGFFTGDGCRYDNKNIVYLYNEKRELLHRFKDSEISYYYESKDNNRIVLHIKNLEDKFFVPDCSYSIESRIDWLSGLLDADGCIAVSGKSQAIQLASVNREFLRNLQYMLQTLGVQSKVILAKAAGTYLLPKNDGSDTLGTYNCKEINRILINGTAIQILLNLGLNTSRLNFTNHIPNRDASRFIKVVKVEDLDRTDDTYCFNEPKRHMGVFNGLLTGQCTEITLHSSEEETFTCILSSLNLAHYDSITEKDVFNATMFLHCVALEFIDKAKGIPGLEAAVDFTRKGMALGLGQCGFHTLLQSKNIPFESLEAQFLNTKIAKFIWEASGKASKYLASIFGEPDWCVGTGLANSHRIAIAPTKSTALIMGGVSEGIGPDPAMIYTQLTSAGEVERIAPEFLKVLRSKNKYTKETVQSIVEAFGSVQHLDFLSEHEKLVFRTAFEIDQHVVLRLASQRQKYIDQAQSINLYFGGDASEEYISKVHRAAFEDENILTLYYCYSKTGVSGSKGECISCQ